jgi:hypothetical protein
MKQSTNTLKKLRGPFMPIYIDATKKCPAWYAMDPRARALVVEIKLMFDRVTENAVGMSARQAAKLLHSGKDIAVMMLKQAVHYGFLAKISDGYLGPNGKGIATQWRLTDEAYLGQPATLDFKRWNGTLFEEKPRSKKTKPRTCRKDRPVPVARTPRTARKDRANGKTRKTSISEKPDPVPVARTFLRSSPSSTASEPVAVRKGEPAEPAEPEPPSGIRRNQERR